MNIMKMTKIHKKRIITAFSDTNGIDIPEFARTLQTTQAVARRIITGNCLVSAKRAIHIENITGISKSIFRPDIFK